MRLNWCVLSEWWSSGKWNGCCFFRSHFDLVPWFFIPFHSNVINLHRESGLNLFTLFSMLPFTCSTKKPQLTLQWIFHVNAPGSNTNIFIVRLITSGLTFCKSCLALLSPTDEVRESYAEQIQARRTHTKADESCTAGYEGGLISYRRASKLVSVLPWFTIIGVKCDWNCLGCRSLMWEWRGSPCKNS